MISECCHLTVAETLVSTFFNTYFTILIVIIFSVFIYSVDVHIYSFFSYTKPKGQLPDYNSPIVLHSEHTTVEDFCNKLHRTIAKEFK